MHTPVGVPDSGIGLPSQGLHPGAEMVAEPRAQGRKRGEKVGVLDPDKTPISVEPSAGHEAVDVGMWLVTGRRP